MKPKFHPIYVIVGLFLFKVGIIDNFRNIAHQSSNRYLASEMTINKLRPIR